MITENLSTLKIHKLTQEQYDRELAAGRIDESALYLTPDDDSDSNAIEYGSSEPTHTPDGGDGSIYLRTGGDAVVEVGTSDIWTYRKWVSGIAECWGNFTFFEVGVNNAWGEIYESSAYETTNFPPDLFNSVPMQTINIISTKHASGGAGYALCAYQYGDGGPTATSAGKVVFYRPTQTGENNQKVVISIHAIGRWK